MSDSQLIARAQKGDEEAFSALFEAHKRRVYSLCLRMTGNTAEAEDLAQEAFLQLFRKISTFRGESAFSTWLHRLTVNVVLMHLRKKGLQQVSLDEPDTSQDEPVKRDYGEAGESPEPPAASAAGGALAGSPRGSGCDP